MSERLSCISRSAPQVGLFPGTAGEFRVITSHQVRVASKKSRRTALFAVICSMSSLALTSGCASSGSGLAAWNPFAKSTDTPIAAAPVTEPTPSGISGTMSNIAQGTRAQASSMGMAVKSAYGKSKDAVTGLFTPGSDGETQTDGEKIADNDPLLLKNKPTSVSPEVFVANGQLYESTGNYERALDNYSKALEKEPNNGPALASIARLHFRQERFEPAVEYFQRAIQATPAEAGLYNDLGLTLSKLGRHDEAVRTIDKALAIAPGQSRYANNLATVQYEAGREDDARATLLKYNKPAVAHYNMAYLYHSAQRNDKALQELGQVLAVTPAADGDSASQRAYAKSRELFDKLGGPATQIAQSLPQMYNNANQSIQAVSQAGSQAGQALGTVRNTLGGVTAQLGDTYQAVTQPNAVPQQNINLSGQPMVNQPIANVAMLPTAPTTQPAPVSQPAPVPQPAAGVSPAPGNSPAFAMPPNYVAPSANVADRPQGTMQR